MNNDNKILSEIKSKLDELVKQSKTQTQTDTVNANTDSQNIEPSSLLDNYHPSDDINRTDIIHDLINAKLMFRDKLIKKHGADYNLDYNVEKKLYELDIINCSGVRQFGSTQAIVEMFDPENDVYIGIDANAINDFKRKLFDYIKDIPKYKDTPKRCFFINFNTINHTNTLITEDMERRLESFLKNVQMVKFDKENNPSSVKKDDLYSALGLSNSFDYTRALRGRSFGTNAKVFVDLGLHTYMTKNIKLMKLIREIKALTLSYNKNIVFIML